MSIHHMFMLKETEIGKTFIIYRRNDDVFRLESPFYLEFNDNRGRAKIL